MDILKTIGRGLLYVLLSPLILAGFALYAVYALGLFIVEFFIATFKFVTGDKLTVETIEDKKVKKFVEKRKKEHLEKLENESKKEEQKPSVNNIFINVSKPEDINNITRAINGEPQRESITVEDPIEIDNVENVIEEKHYEQLNIMETPEEFDDEEEVIEDDDE